MCCGIECVVLYGYLPKEARGFSFSSSTLYRHATAVSNPYVRTSRRDVLCTYAPIYG